MGIEALTHRDDGTARCPQTASDWDRWVSPTRTRNFILDDPLLDWLELYGEAHGFERDPSSSQYDPRTDFTEFLFEQGHKFEAAIAELLGKGHHVETIATTPRVDARRLEQAEATFAAMERAVPIIYQGVLWDAEHRTYGIPDLLVRTDVLRELFPDAISPAEAGHAAPDLPGANWHYRVVDIKFTTLYLSSRGELDNSGSGPTYKAQLFIYNRALGRLQGYESPMSYLLGRGWTQGRQRGSSALDRLAPVPQAGTVTNKTPIAEITAAAVQWVRRVRSASAAWEVLPKPSVPELYPNGSNDMDAPWHNAKRRIASELDELTQLWWVSPKGRRQAHEVGISRWTDPRVTPEHLGITRAGTASTLAHILNVNRDANGPVVHPPRIGACREEWHSTPPLEFYVDFESVSDLADDFSRLPERGGQPLIFMIGCGHVEAGTWRFESFVVDALTEPEEARIIAEWLAHMEQVRQRLALQLATPRLIHWSPAEVSFFEKAYDSARARQRRPDWPSLNWFDFLQRVVRAEPIVLRGALAFGLKAVAKAMHAHGLIETLWGDGPADGLGAMVGAWWCAEESRRTGVPMSRIDLMQDIICYNEVDCKVMMEIVRYLRENH